MSKPIEPVCIAVMIKGAIPQFDGLIVNVISLYDNRYPPLNEVLKRSPTGRWWVIDSEKIRSVTPPGALSITHEANLRRIDDGNLDLQHEESDELTKVF